MMPIIWRVMTRYAPYITLPVAALVGVIGYNLENILSDKYTPYQKSIVEKRTERQLANEGNDENESVESLLGRKMMSGVLEKNLSPSLSFKETKPKAM